MRGRGRRGGPWGGGPWGGPPRGPWGGHQGGPPGGPWDPSWGERWHHAHWHHAHWHRRHRYKPLRVRLFRWFGAAIIAAIVTVSAAYSVLGGPRGGRASLERAERFVVSRFAVVWNDPPARRELATSLARDVGISSRLRAPDGTVLESTLPAGGCRRAQTLPVGSGLGTAELCTDAFFPGPHPWQLPVAIAFTGIVLWAIAGAVSRRITRPLDELTRVARRLGEGDLSARPSLCFAADRGEIGDLTVAINEMAERIELQLKDQRQLLAAVSHELRTPLTRIRLLLELARDGGAGAGADPLGQIDAEVVEIDALVADLLASSRVDFSALSPRELGVEAVAQQALGRAGLPPGALVVEGVAGTLAADPTLLARALGNLLDNARKYGGPCVVLRVCGGPERVVFAVEDDGPGFSPDDEQKVFEPFYRGRAAGAGSGVGLGLALVKRIAQAHGGAVAAGNLPGGGARVALELPREPPVRARA